MEMNKKIQEAVKLVEVISGKKIILENDREKNIIVKNATNVSDSYEIFRTDLQILADSLENSSEYSNQRIQINSIIFKLQRLEKILSELIN